MRPIWRVIEGEWASWVVNGEWWHHSIPVVAFTSFLGWLIPQSLFSQPTLSKTRDKRNVTWHNWYSYPLTVWMSFHAFGWYSHFSHSFLIWGPFLCLKIQSLISILHHLLQIKWPNYSCFGYAGIANAHPSFQYALCSPRLQILSSVSCDWKLLDKFNNGNFDVGGVEMRRCGRFLVKACATTTLEPKRVAGEEGEVLGSKMLLESCYEDSEGLDEREKLRRMRISKANKGNTPWNKGRKLSKHSAGNWILVVPSITVHFFFFVLWSSNIGCVLNVSRNFAENQGKNKTCNAES